MYRFLQSFDRAPLCQANFHLGQEEQFYVVVNTVNPANGNICLNHQGGRDTPLAGSRPVEIILVISTGRCCFQTAPPKSGYTPDAIRTIVKGVVNLLDVLRLTYPMT